MFTIAIYQKNFGDHLYLVGNARSMKDISHEGSGIIRIHRQSGAIENDLITQELNTRKEHYIPRWNWFFGIMEYKDQLIIPNAMFSKNQMVYSSVTDNAFFTFDDTGAHFSTNVHAEKRIKYEHFFPVDTMLQKEENNGSSIVFRPFESLEFNGKLIYTLRTYSKKRHLYQESYNNSVGFVYKG